MMTGLIIHGSICALPWKFAAPLPNDLKIGLDEAVFMELDTDHPWTNNDREIENISEEEKNGTRI